MDRDSPFSCEQASPLNFHDLSSYQDALAILLISLITLSAALVFQKVNFVMHVTFGDLKYQNVSSHALVLPKKADQLSNMKKFRLNLCVVVGTIIIILTFML